MRNSLIAGAAATFLMIAGNVAMAQQQPVAAPDAAAPQQANPQQPALPAFPQPDWSKLCAQTPSGKDACQTIRDLRTPDLVMSIQVSQEKGSKPIMNVMLPTGMVLAVGARVVVDGQTIDTARYKYCQGPYCFADLALTDANLATLKKGKKLTVAGRDGAGAGRSHRDWHSRASARHSMAQASTRTLSRPIRRPMPTSSMPSSNPSSRHSRRPSSSKAALPHPHPTRSRACQPAAPAQ